MEQIPGTKDPESLILRYYLESPEKVEEIDLPSFLAFRDWLWSLGVGQDRGDPRMFEWWMKAYTELDRKRIRPINFGRGRKAVGSVLHILRVK